MKNFKKISLGTATLSVSVAPVIAIIGCDSNYLSNKVEDENFKSRLLSDKTNSLTSSMNNLITKTVLNLSEDKFTGKKWSYSGAVWPDSIAGQKMCIGGNSFASKALLKDGNNAATKYFLGYTNVKTVDNSELMNITFTKILNKGEAKFGASDDAKIMAEFPSDVDWTINSNGTKIGKSPFVIGIFDSSGADSDWIENNGFNKILPGTQLSLTQRTDGTNVKQSDFFNKYFGDREKWTYNFDYSKAASDWKIHIDELKASFDASKKLQNTTNKSLLDSLSNYKFPSSLKLLSGKTVNTLGVIDWSSQSSGDITDALNALESMSKSMKAAAARSLGTKSKDNMISIDVLKHSLTEIKSQLKEIAFKGANEINLPSMDDNGKTLFIPDDFNNWVNADKKSEIGNIPTNLTYSENYKGEGNDFGVYKDVLSAYLTEAEKLGIKVNLKTIDSVLMLGSSPIEGTLAKSRPDWMSRNAQINGETLTRRPDGIRVRGLSFQNTQVKNYVSFYSQYLTRKLPNVQNIILGNLGNLWAIEQNGIKGQFGFNAEVVKQMLLDSTDLQKNEDFDLFYKTKRERELEVETLTDKQAMEKMFHAVTKNGAEIAFQTMLKKYYASSVASIIKSIQNVGGHVILSVSKITESPDGSKVENGRGLDYKSLQKNLGSAVIDEILFEKGDDLVKTSNLITKYFKNSKKAFNGSLKNGSETTLDEVQKTDGSLLFDINNDYEITLAKFIMNSGNVKTTGTTMSFGSIYKVNGGSYE